MRNLLRAGAFALALLLCAGAPAQVTLPFIYNYLGQKAPAQAVVCVDLLGAYVGCGGSGGPGGDPSYTGASGSTTIPGNIAVTGGWDGTNLRRFLTDTSGRQVVNVNSLPSLPSGSNTIGSIANTAFALNASENTIGQITANTVLVGGSFTRPANTTAYVSGQLVANSTTAGSVVAQPIVGASRINAGTGAITGVRLSKSGTSITNASFRVHFFRGAYTAANGDGATYLVNGIAAVHIGYVDVTMDQAFTDGAQGEAAPARNFLSFQTGASSNTIYWAIEARAGYVPTSAETFAIACEITRN